jgi:hypothetical protein
MRTKQQKTCDILEKIQHTILYTASRHVRYIVREIPKKMRDILDRILILYRFCTCQFTEFTGTDKP